MGLKLITAPTELPVTLAQAKLHLREDASDYDSQIQLMLEAAISYVDGPNGFLGRALIDQTWDYYLDTFAQIQSTLGGKGFIELPLPPLISVTSVNYTDSAGNEQTLPTTSYVVDDSTKPARIALTSTGNWPTISNEFKSIRIRFRAGYLDQTVSPAVSAVPGQIKAAILLLVGSLYENRETEVVGTVVNRLPVFENLLRPYRVYLSLA